MFLGRVNKSYRLTVPESYWMNFLTRTGLVQHWTDFYDRLTQLQGLQTGYSSAAENIRSAQETYKCLCKWWPLWAQTVTGGVAYKLVMWLFHIGNFCFWAPFFKQLLLKNCAVDFVEICNVCTRKVIIKAAKRIFNSDRICCSYFDFYVGVTFLEHTVYSFKRNWQFDRTSSNVKTCLWQLSRDCHGAGWWGQQLRVSVGCGGCRESQEGTERRS